MSTSNKQSCCEMRRKVVVGIARVLSEAECGVSDTVMADYHDFGYQSDTGVPVAVALAFRFCPWCGTKREANHERRTTEVIRQIDHDEDKGEEWKSGGQEDLEP